MTTPQLGNSTDSPLLSVIIPIGPGDDAWIGLLPCLAHLAHLPQRAELIFVSTEATPALNTYSESQWRELNENFRVLWLISERGRARQQNLGARQATGRYLWFLHADSRFDQNVVDELKRATANDNKALFHFRLRLTRDESPDESSEESSDNSSSVPMAVNGRFSSRPKTLTGRLTFLNSIGANLRSRWFKMPFGDQGFLIKRDVFFSLGAFDELAPYGEDHLLVWRARRRGLKVTELAATITTSMRKYETQGWLKVSLTHLALTFKQAAPEFARLLLKRREPTIALVCFVKTPGLSPVKTRLAATLGQDAATRIYLECVARMTTLMKNATSLGLAPYWAVAEDEGTRDPLWKDFSVIQQEEGGLGERLKNVFESLYRRHIGVILIGADCPDLTSSHLKECLEQMRSGTHVIGPSLDGGYYLFGTCLKVDPIDPIDPIDHPEPSRVTPDSSVWLRVPYSAANTAECFTTELQVSGRVHKLEKLSDLDTEADLAHLKTPLTSPVS